MDLRHQYMNNLSSKIIEIVKSFGLEHRLQSPMEPHDSRPHAKFDKLKDSLDLKHRKCTLSSFENQ